MKDNLYLMYNRLSCRYSDAFSCATDAVAKKRVRELLVRSQTDLNDFDLFKIGSFDVENCTVDYIPRERLDFRQGDTIFDVEKQLEKESSK